MKLRFKPVDKNFLYKLLCEQMELCAEKKVPFVGDLMQMSEVEALRRAADARDFEQLGSLFLYSSRMTLVDTSPHQAKSLQYLALLIEYFRADADGLGQFFSFYRKIFIDGRNWILRDIPVLEKPMGRDHHKFISYVSMHKQFQKFLRDFGISEIPKEFQRFSPESLEEEIKTFKKHKQKDKDKNLWELISESKQGSESIGEQIMNLSDLLTRQKRKSVANFQIQLREVLDSLMREDIWAVGEIVNGGLGDDEVEAFTAWIVLQGKEFTERFLKNPAEVALEIPVGEDVGCEDLPTLAGSIYYSMYESELKHGVIPGVMSTELKLSWNSESLPMLYPALWKKFSGDR